MTWKISINAGDINRATEQASRREREEVKSHELFIICKKNCEKYATLPLFSSPPVVDRKLPSDLLLHVYYTAQHICTRRVHNLQSP